jgi:hypothetical protein
MKEIQSLTVRIPRRACLALLALVPFVVSSCASTSKQNAAAPPAPYIRVANPDEDTSSLQIAARRLDPPKRRGAMVWLVAVSHIGEPRYYEEIQQLLDAQELVLFEGVGGVPEPTVESTNPDAPEKSDHLQSNLAAALGLIFQFDGIEYDRAHFQNSDLTIRELQSLVMGGTSTTQPGAGGASAATGDGAAGAGAEAEFGQLMELMEGTSIMGMLVNVGLNLVARSPSLQAVMRLVMVESLGNLKGDIAQLQSLPPQLQRLVEVIIQERNKTVMTDLESALTAANPPRTIAVFYGAGHMADLERRLREELGYRPGEDRWFTAFSANVKETGLSESQINWLRTLVQRQLDQLEFHSEDSEPEAIPPAQ